MVSFFGFVFFFKQCIVLGAFDFCGSRCHVKDYRWLRQVYLTDVVHISLLNRRQYARLMSEVRDIAGKYYFVELIKYVIPYLKCFWHSATNKES